MPFILSFQTGYVYLESAVGKNKKVESFKLESLIFEIFVQVGKSRAKSESFF